MPSFTMAQPSIFLMTSFYNRLFLLLALGVFSLTANAQRQLTRADFYGIIVPKYLVKGGSATRIPTAYFARVANLSPNSTYKFISQAAILTDTGSGAGNPLFLNPGGTALYTSNASLATANNGSFTTNAQGEFSGWFSFITTANARFNTRNEIVPTLILNDGNNGTAIAKRLGLDQTMRVLILNAAVSDTTATAIYGTSLATAKNVVALYDSEDASGRPLSTAIVESIGATIASTPTWYANNVAGQAGAWGTIVPNQLANGVRNITQYGVDGAVVGNNTTTDGTWASVATVNPTGAGTTPLVIASSVAPLNVVTAAKARISRSFTAFFQAEQSQIVVSSTESTRLRVCSLTGQTIVRANVAHGQQTAISTHGWMPGLYILVDEQSGRTARVIVR